MRIPPLSKLKLELSTSRIQALTDGVFAIAMTLLVLNLEIAEPTSHNSAKEIFGKILALWPNLLHYAESFLILAIFWIKHHQQFHFIKKSDSNLLWLNIVSLLFVCLIPFSTSLVGDYGTYRSAAIFFEANLMLAGFLYYFQWVYATKNNRLVDSDIQKNIIIMYKRYTLVTPLVSIAAIIISLFVPRLGTLAYISIPFIFMVINRK